MADALSRAMGDAGIRAKEDESVCESALVPAPIFGSVVGASLSAAITVTHSGTKKELKRMIFA